MKTLTGIAFVGFIMAMIVIGFGSMMATATPEFRQALESGAQGVEALADQANTPKEAALGAPQTASLNQQVVSAGELELIADDLLVLHSTPEHNQQNPKTLALKQAAALQWTVAATNPGGFDPNKLTCMLIAMENGATRVALFFLDLIDPGVTVVYWWDPSNPSQEWGAYEKPTQKVHRLRELNSQGQLKPGQGQKSRQISSWDFCKQYNNPFGGNSATP